MHPAARMVSARWGRVLHAAKTASAPWANKRPGEKPVFYYLISSAAGAGSPCRLNSFTMFRYIMACVCMLVSGTSIAQISSFRLQASGLTCALCARSIHKNLETVAWISRIETDLERSEFIISVKPDMAIDADLITKKVEDAGFGVAGLTANARIPQESVAPDRHLILNGMTVHIVSTKQASGDGEIMLKLVDKAFLGSKDQKKFAKLSKHDCFMTGKASGECCRSAGITEGSRIFHVII